MAKETDGDRPFAMTQFVAALGNSFRELLIGQQQQEALLELVKILYRVSLRKQFHEIRELLVE